MLAFAAAVLALGCTKGAPASGDPIRVAAASDLAFAFKDVGAAFTAKTGRVIAFSFGSTGLLAKQIQEGAPFDVFAAANVSYVDDVVRAGMCAADSKTTYATGRIVMWTKDGIAPPASLAELGDPKWRRIAIANPEHAPYGRAARDAMVRAGAWPVVQSRVVYGENVQQALQFARSGNADVAIVALSLAVVTDGGAFASIDPSAHAPLEQALVACKGKNEVPRDQARAFAAFVGSEEGRAIMKKYGFLLPGESPAAIAR